jgi:IMP dehydrogenase/GMP reductase
MTDAIPEKVYAEKIDGLESALMEMVQDYEKYKTEISQVTESLAKMRKRKPYREYYGMSTKKAQMATGGNGTTTSEGISRPIPIEYNIAKWADNMKSYLISVMSYTNSRDLDELRENTELVINLSGDKSFRK